MEIEWYIDRTEEDPAKREKVRTRLFKKARARVREFNIEPGDEEEIKAQIKQLTNDRAVAARRVQRWSASCRARGGNRS